MGTVVLREVVAMGEGQIFRCDDRMLSLHDMVREMIGLGPNGEERQPARYEIIAYYPTLEANNVRSER